MVQVIKMMKKSNSTGFTAIEVVMAIAILVLVMSVSYGSLRQIIHSKNALDETRALRKTADVVLTRLVRELQLSYNGKGGLLPPKDDLKNVPSDRIKLRGEPKELEGVPSDQITFLAQEGGQYLPDGGRHSGLVQISYRLEEDPESTDRSARILVREEIPYTRPFDRAYGFTMTFPVSRDVSALGLRYYSTAEEKWFNSWGIENRVNLPQIIEISIGIRSPQGKEQTLTTAVPLGARAEN